MPALDLCPRCEEPKGNLVEVRTSTMGKMAVWRCVRCGTRATTDETHRFIFTCGSCGLPFPARQALEGDDQLCEACGKGGKPVEVPDEILAEATDVEIRAALRRCWRFVTHETLQDYLDRVTREVAGQIDDSRDAARVVLVDDTAQVTLSLPTTLLISVGTLRFLRDEAELAFVLAHELGHAASGDPASRLMRLGFRSTSELGSPDTDSWGGAAMDLVRLGYGRRREHEADERALRAVLGLGYDPGSVLRYLRRVRSAMESGDETVSQLATAHPPADERIRRIERLLFERVRPLEAAKTNRARFRRALSPGRLESEMVETELPREAPKTETVRPAWRRRLGRRLKIAAALAAFALLLLALGWFVAG